MNKFITKLKNFIFKTKHSTSDVSHDNSIDEHNKFIQPKFIRVYSYYDLPKECVCGSLMWDVININDEKLLEKIYHHISTANKIYYYCSKTAIECSIKTKKFGWCLLVLHYSLYNTEFGIWRSNTRYDIYYRWELEKCASLYNFLQKFVLKAIKEYKNDRNL